MNSKPYADYDGPIADVENVVALEEEAANVRDAIVRMWGRYLRLEHIFNQTDVDGIYGLLQELDSDADAIYKAIGAAREKCENRLDACLDIPDEDEEAVE